MNETSTAVPGRDPALPAPTPCGRLCDRCKKDCEKGTKGRAKNCNLHAKPCVRHENHRITHLCEDHMSKRPDFTGLKAALLVSVAIACGYAMGFSARGLIAHAEHSEAECPRTECPKLPEEVPTRVMACRQARFDHCVENVRTQDYVQDCALAAEQLCDDNSYAP